MTARPAARGPGRRARAIRLGALAALLGALAIPAAAYLPPAAAILRRAAQRRDELGISAVEARGTVAFAGEAARRVAEATGLPSPGAELTAPAVLLIKSPGRCRLELAPPGAAPANRPALSTRGGRLTGVRGLDNAPSARALLEGACFLLGERSAGERGLGQRLASRGVALSEVALGRMGARVAWVLGGRPLSGRPQAWIDKQSYLPIRLVAPLAGATRDVRLVDLGSSVGGEAFPRAVEVWSGGQLEARFSAEKVISNPKLPDAMF